MSFSAKSRAGDRFRQLGAGLATVRVERLGRPAMEVTHVEITDAGRKAIGA